MDIQIHFGPNYYVDHGFKNPESGNGYSIGGIVLNPTSKGSVTLSSSDFRANPVIDHNYLSKDDDVTIVGGGGKDTISFKSSEEATADYITFTGLNSAVAAADTISLDQSWWADDGFSVTGNPAGAGKDTLNLGPTRLPGGMGEDHISIGLDDVYKHHFPAKPQPELKYKSQKYQEDKGIADLTDYVSSTYQGHYTNDNSDVQTLDLIHSVGDAESFCRSNALKYLSRYDKKGSAKRDILKAMHYCLLLYYFSGNTNNETPTRGYETF